MITGFRLARDQSCYERLGSEVEYLQAGIAFSPQFEAGSSTGTMVG